MVRTQVEPRPFQTKRSFMIEDLLRTESCGTDSSLNSASRDRPVAVVTKTSSTEVRPVDQSTQAPCLSVDQERLLAQAFSLLPYPNKKQRQHLAVEVRTTEHQVKLWFRERRATLKNQLSHDRQRSAKLAYLNSLANSLVMQSTTPRQPARAAVPFVGYPPAPCSRPRVAIPSWYSRSAARRSPYILPASPSLNGRRSYWYY